MNTKSYLKLVVQEVASQGKPNGDFVEVLSWRIKDAICKVVPNNYRLAVRVAIRKYIEIAQTALNGI